MVTKFDFSSAGQVIFGSGSISKLKTILPEIGKNIFLITGQDFDRASIVIDEINKTGIAFTHYCINTEPNISAIETGVQIAHENGCDSVVGFGGGSVIDAAKAIAVLIPNNGKLIDHLEVIGNSRPFEEMSLPCIAIPTTSGTGAEVTKNAVIKSSGFKVKVSLRNPFMFPKVAIVDPQLTLSVPPALTASTGIDALTHLFEAFLSNQPNQFVDMLCREGMKRITESLENAFHNGSNLHAREDMSMASLLGGMALANGKLGAIHGFAGAVGGMFVIPHGVACAAFLPSVYEMNLGKSIKQNNEFVLNKFTEVSQILCKTSECTPQDGLKWIKKLVSSLEIPSLTEFGIRSKDYSGIAKKAKAASSMKGNPVELEMEDLLRILENTF